MRRARLLVAALLIGLLALTGCAATPLPGSQAHYVLKFHHDLLESSPQHIAAVHWANEVAKRTNGQVEVQVFAANQVGDDREAIEMLMIGNLQGAIIPTAKLSLFVPQMQLADLPFLFPNADIAHKVLDGKVGDAMLAASEPVGLKGLAFWESGFKQFTGDRPFLKPQDFAGLKFRTMESPVVIEQFKALGANPTPINLSETYNALQQRVVDGQENPLVSIVNLRFYEVQSHVTYSNHAYLGYAFLLSKAWYDKLPADLQKVLQETVREATVFQREESARQEQGFLNVLKASKSQVTVLPEANRPLFEAATRPVHERFANAIGRDLLQQAYSEIDQLKRDSR
ncbi:MAG TPA: TRAP transporter substrate-binding protein [Symbiobacteriaceae bacterium]|nr:TRAP transporter substrate-binding protein [Symbiobacteriaceae bacterium]